MEFEKIMLKMSIDDNNRHFREYLNLIKVSIEKKESELQMFGVKMEKDLEGKNDEYKNNAYDHYADLRYEVETFEQMLYRSLTVSIFMFMEDLLSQLCSHLKKHTRQVFSNTDLKGNGIGRSVEYIKKTTGHCFPKDEETRMCFNVAWLVRNAVIHADGKIRKEKRKTIESYILKKQNQLELDDVGRILIKPEYAESLLQLNIDFAKEVSDNWLEELFIKKT